MTHTVASAVALMCGMVLATQASALPSPVERHVVVIGDWRLAITRDRFAGDVHCELRSRDHRVLYKQNAAGFRFPSRWDVGETVYRVDGGPPRLARDDLPELIRDGVPVDAGGMSNPTVGIVWIPIHLLEGANKIAIQPRPNSRPRTFHFRGLVGLRDIAIHRGCTPGRSFER